MWETWVLSLGWEDPPGEGKGHPLQYSGLENSTDCTVHGVTKSQTWLSDFHFTSPRNSPVQMWELDNEEGWVPKSWWFWFMVLEKVLESPLHSKINSVNPKRNQPWIFIGRTVAEALILWPFDAKSWLFGKDPGAGKDWGQEEKEKTEDEMVGWHHRFNGHEFDQTPWDSEGQGSLMCCSPWDHKGLDMTERLNNNRNHTLCPELGKCPKHVSWTDLAHCQAWFGKPRARGSLKS